VLNILAIALLQFANFSAGETPKTATSQASAIEIGTTTTFIGGSSGWGGDIAEGGSSGWGGDIAA